MKGVGLSHETAVQGLSSTFSPLPNVFITNVSISFLDPLENGVSQGRGHSVVQVPGSVGGT